MGTFVGNGSLINKPLDIDIKIQCEITTSQNAFWEPPPDIDWPAREDPQVCYMHYPEDEGHWVKGLFEVTGKVTECEEMSYFKSWGLFSLETWGTTLIANGHSFECRVTSIEGGKVRGISLRTLRTKEPPQ